MEDDSIAAVQKYINDLRIENSRLKAEKLGDSAISLFGKIEILVNQVDINIQQLKQLLKDNLPHD